MIMPSRIFFSVISLILRSGEKRAKFFRRMGVFNHIGDNVMIQGWKVPLYPKLISIGNNVRIASNVTFCTHDVAHNMLNNIESDFYASVSDKVCFKEMKGRIEIGDNVFIGANTPILYNTKIGNNVIVAAGSVVTKDLDGDSVYAGVPARKVGTFIDFVKKRIEYTKRVETI